MRLHLAILYKDYLNLIMEGKKTIEARLSKVKCPPYESVSIGDKIFLKETGGPIKGEVIVRDVKYYSNLTPERLVEIINKYKKGLMINDNFLTAKIGSKYLTLIFLSEVKKYMKKIPFNKKDRRAWVLLSNEQQPILFDFGKNGGVK